jgi:hypothetical protein
MPAETIGASKKVGSRFSGASRGILVALTESCEPLVDFPGNPGLSTLSAHSTVALSKDDVGREIVLVFEDGDPSRPILIGLLQSDLRAEKRPVDLVVDGRRITLSAEQQIVLRCGEASITLNRAGKVLIRGKYVVSRSSGVNMVKGAIVHVN